MKRNEMVINKVTMKLNCISPKASQFAPNFGVYEYRVKTYNIFHKYINLHAI